MNNNQANTRTNGIANVVCLEDVKFYKNKNKINLKVLSKNCS